MSVEDWAREQAESFYGKQNDRETIARRLAFMDGAQALADALLSDDKAARAAVRQLTEFGRNTPAKFRAALQAAVEAVTEPKTHDSSTTRTGEQ